MQHGVLNPTNIQVYRHPVSFFFLVPGMLSIMRINETEEVPATSRPLRHGISLTKRRLSCLRISRFHPTPYSRQGRLPGSGRSEAFYIRQKKRQTVRIKRLRLTVNMDNRKGLTPIALTAKQPVTQFVRDCT